MLRIGFILIGLIAAGLLAPNTAARGEIEPDSGSTGPSPSGPSPSGPSPSGASTSGSRSESAADGTHPIDPKNAPNSALAAFQIRDQRMQDIGWRLVRGNADFCDRVVPSIGLQLQDMAVFARPDTVRTALGFSGDFGVQSAAEGSPAGLAAISPNREIVRLGEIDPNSWPAGERFHWQRLARAHDWIDQHLARRGSLAIGFTDGTAISVKAVRVCATRFEILGESRKAMAEGERVIIGSRFPGFDWPEDEIFAGVIAHELAHNLLHHRAFLDRNGRKRRNIRRTEREADRLTPWLLANAGYNPEAAYRFMVRWGKDHDLGLFRARTHDGWDERADFIAAELPIIADLTKCEGKADWSVHFRREIDPEKRLRSAEGRE